MQTILLPALLLLTACQPDTIRVGGVEFIEQRIEVAEGESALAFADVNHDGHLDLLVASSTAGEVMLLRGDGRGGFTQTGRFAAGANPTDVAAADINEDGNVDLVIANHETTYLTLLVGDGSGGFQPASNSPIGIDVGPHPHKARIADVDLDNHADIIVDDRDGEGLLIIRGLGGGQFDGGGIRVAVGGDPYLGFAMGDINGDGRLDLVTPNPTEIAVTMSSGPGGFGFEQPVRVAAGSPFAVALVDVNGDGHLDVVAASDGAASRVQVYLGSSGSEFAEGGGSPFRIAGGGKDIAVGDVNGDGFDDVLVSSWSSDALFVLGGAGAFETVRLPQAGNPWGLAIGDVNGDGADDFAIADGVDASLQLYVSSR